MSTEGWYLVIGALLLLIALVSGLIARWPLTTAIVYLVIGIIFGQLHWISLDMLRHASWLERASEIAVIVSLFSAGLKLRLPLTWRHWRLPIILATLSMTLTVALIAGIGVLGFGWPLGVAVILGAILAPTDPVLASDVQIADTRDEDPVRTALTGEAGLNDGTAFPLLMLGLGLLGQYELGPAGLHWLAIDVLWKVPAGFAIGALVGGMTAFTVLHLRRRHEESLGFDDFLALGVIATAYGLAHLVHAYGFIAVFAAGWAIRAIERRQSTPQLDAAPPVTAADESMAADQTRAPAFLAAAVLKFNDHMDRLGELIVVLLVGALLTTFSMHWGTIIFALALFLLIRPLAVVPICLLTGMSRGRTALVAWFGIRGIGSVYYLAYAITHGLPESWVGPVTTTTLTIVAASTLLHGLSSTPAMQAYTDEGLRWTRRQWR